MFTLQGLEKGPGFSWNYTSSPLVPPKHLLSYTHSPALLPLAVRLVRSNPFPQFVPREGSTVPGQNNRNRPPLCLGLRGPDDSHSKQWAPAEARLGEPHRRGLRQGKLLQKVRTSSVGTFSQVSQAKLRVFVCGCRQPLTYLDVQWYTL